MVTIEHASVYAEDPKRAADALAAICGGRAAPFSPLPGAWVCFFSSGAFIELYPRTARLKDLGADVGFEQLAEPATGAGTHFNLRLHRTREDVEKACAAQGIKCAQRPGLGFLDVWIEEGLLVECVCAG